VVFVIFFHIISPYARIAPGLNWLSRLVFIQNYLPPLFQAARIKTVNNYLGDTYRNILKLSLSFGVKNIAIVVDVKRGGVVGVDVSLMRNCKFSW